jgi:translation initiation factor 2B subunit (eIF-2B alpha/beta/delta family)
LSVINNITIINNITMWTSHHNHFTRTLLRSSVMRTYSSTSVWNDRIVIAVGGNALQRRGERLTIENMLKAAADMAPTVAQLAREHEVVLTHGNGPQVGELALERSAATFDVCTY